MNTNRPTKSRPVKIAVLNRVNIVGVATRQQLLDGEPLAAPRILNKYLDELVACK